MGAAVLHEDTVVPVRRKDIPVNIRNTNDPEAEGTIIRESFEADNAGENVSFYHRNHRQEGFLHHQPAQTNMSDSVGSIRRVLEVLEQYRIPIIAQISSGIDSFSLVVPTDKLAPVKYDLISDIKRNCQITDINVQDDISLIAISDARWRTAPAFPAKSSVPWVQTGLISAPSSRVPMRD